MQRPGHVFQKQKPAFSAIVFSARHYFLEEGFSGTGVRKGLAGKRRLPFVAHTRSSARLPSSRARPPGSRPCLSGGAAGRGDGPSFKLWPASRPRRVAARRVWASRHLARPPIRRSAGGVKRRSRPKKGNTDGGASDEERGRKLRQSPLCLYYTMLYYTILYYTMLLLLLLHYSISTISY